MMESERVSVEQAARELHMAPQGVREYMKRNLLNIGEVFPAVTVKKGQKQKYRYRIYRKLLDEYKHARGIP